MPFAKVAQCHQTLPFLSIMTKGEGVPRHTRDDMVSVFFEQLPCCWGCSKNIIKPFTLSLPLSIPSQKNKVLAE
jgi:hypothetical protein